MLDITPSAGFSQTLRCELRRQPGMLGRLTSAIGAAGGDIEAVEIVEQCQDTMIRDINVMARDEQHCRRIVQAALAVDGVHVAGVTDRVFERHLGGKVGLVGRTGVRTPGDLAMVYTPGVGRVSRAIADDPALAWDYTIRSNTVAVLTDGSAVLGLGNIGPEAAMPVMEGKALLFKEFAGVDAFPVCVDARSVDELVAVGKAIAPTFGGINLEDIAAPQCFEVEQRLAEAVDIPVFHDDQHGTAIVVLAALRNAAKVVGKPLDRLRVLIHGMGAAGVACVRLLNHVGVGDIIGCDRRGVIHPDRDGLDDVKRSIAAVTNREGRTGGAADALEGMDVFLGLSGPQNVEPDWIKRMSDHAIVFALANPVPEIMPERLPDNVLVVATGRSDYPNQINNVLAFPGMFRGLLDARASEVTFETERAAAEALAAIVSNRELRPDYIIPSPFDERVVPAISMAVRAQLEAAGSARVVRATE